jgi:exodeoxyribonuclease-3
MSESSLAVLTLNIASPSRPRAENLLDWLSERPEQIFVLTETGASSGSEVIAERLRAAGWLVQAPAPGDGERGVMVCSRLVVRPQPAPVSYLRERVEVVSVDGIEVIGVYAPSRDATAARIARKRRFLAELFTVIGEGSTKRRVLIGDLNIVERSQRRDGGFFEWEYELYEDLPRLGWLDAYRTLYPDRVEQSWVDSEGRGYRFDHTFITADLLESTSRCEYVHAPRENELSDHSAMVVELAGVSAEALEVDSSLSEGPPSLF